MESSDKVEFLEGSLLLFCHFVLGLIFFSAIAANLLVLLVFYRKPGLRTTANRFVINLMIINVVSCVLLIPITLIDRGTLIKENYLCFVEQFSSVFCSSVIVYSVLLIAIDQYFAVVNPLHYHCIISSWKAYLMIFTVWIFSAFLALLGVLQPELGIFHNSSLRQCNSRSEKIIKDSNLVEEDKSVSFSNSLNLYRIVFCVLYATFAFILPFGFICFIYCRICAAASGNTKRAKTSILNTEDMNNQLIKYKFQNEMKDSEKVSEKSSRFVSSKSSDTLENVSADPMESSSLLVNYNHECSSKPFFVVTRPSPPRPLPEINSECTKKCEYEKKNEKKCVSDVSVHKNLENCSKIKTEAEVPFLKPTLKSNASLSKLSSLHIQFSNSIENLIDRNPERRHSNTPVTIKDPEFENISKNRSSSIQSNFYEIPSRSSSSTRSTATSSQIHSSRSSSLISTATTSRHPPSRASSIKSTSSYIVHNIRHRISNASLFRYREEAKAARISALVIVMALFCWLPFFTVFSLRSGMCLESFSRFAHYLDVSTVALLLLSTVISPFLFAFRNRQMKKEIRKIFQFCSEDWHSSRPKSFYKHNFAVTLKSHTIQLFTELTSKKDLKTKKESAFVLH